MVRAGRHYLPGHTNPWEDDLEIAPQRRSTGGGVDGAPEQADRTILSVDIGGTFTDLVLCHERTGRISVAKVLTTDPDPSAGVLGGIRQLLEGGAGAGEIGRLIHGTTLITNALIERKGALTGLLTTEGFRDVLEIGREGRYDIYDLFLQLPEPLAERRLRLEVAERLKSSGQVMTPLDEEALRRACAVLREAGVEAVAVAFLHSYANPDHERRAAAIVREELPGIALSLSHEVAPELREYERTSTAVANAYVQPMASAYLANLERGLRADCGIEAPLHIMLSNGGTCAADTAARFPVRLVESGPSGGVLAAIHAGRQSGFERVLAFDMGGTTAKACLSRDGELPVTTESEVARVYRFKKGSGLPLLVPVLDMIEIGAGGGSLARINELGLPQVGPESAGSEPGPACYGRGGREPTVTDADLVLGLLNPGFFLGGRMELDACAAETAVLSLAGRLGQDAVAAARGIHQLVNENMANAARVHGAERGIDLRGFAMVATGGAGPVHACGVAERLGIDTVVVPGAAGVGSALGLMLAPISFDFARSYVTRLEEVDIGRLRALFEEMEGEGRRIVAEAGVSPGEVQVERTADLRYVGQGHEIRVPVCGGELDEAAMDRLQAGFDQEYIRLYGRTCEGVDAQCMHWRTTVSGPRPALGRLHQDPPEGLRPVEKPARRVRFERPGNDSGETPVYDRYVLSAGFRAPGPAIVEEAESTTVVPPGWALEVDGASNLIVRRTRG